MTGESLIRSGPFMILFTKGPGPGITGIPQPKPGAVTKAHGGVLFIDEIGELHPVQMNKLKVLEAERSFWRAPITARRIQYSQPYS